MKESVLNKIYKLYSEDFSYSEFEKLFHQDPQGVYQYFIKNIDKSGGSKSSLKKFIYFSKYLAITFLRKLSYGRRIIFTLSVLMFIYAYFIEDWLYVSTSFILLIFLILLEVTDKFTARDELIIARNIQESLLPLENPTSPGYEVSYFYEAAQEVGGDFIDFYHYEDRNYFNVTIGDVSGKGLGAALYMFQTKSLLKQILKSKPDSIHLLKELNSTITGSLKKGYFLSILNAFVNEDEISISRAGHNPALYFNYKEKQFREIKPSGIAIGLSKNGLFENSLNSETIKMNSGDLLLLYTDGLNEAMNNKNQQFGMENIQSVMYYYSDKSADEIKNVIVSNVKLFRGNQNPNDDISFVILKRL
ncbi:MAG TPA: SpoIIE family protein phosphatase [Ignavibacteria bacterium]|nr:SpoIIE family protein phosphatase [Ignavibacteria bacterium]